MRVRSLICAFAAIAGLSFSAAATSAAVIFQDNFDSYANQAAFDAAWPASGTTGGETLTSSIADSLPNSIQGNTLAGFRSSHSITATPPSDTEDVQFSFNMLVPDTQQSRQFMYLTSGAANASGLLLELGVYNSPASNKWFVRMLGSAEANSFAPIAGGADRVANQWTELKAIIHKESATTASAKIYVDGTLGATLTGFTLRSYDDVRIGSNISSVANAYFDDVSVQTVPVPEPASLGLLAVAGLGLLRRRRA